MARLGEICTINMGQSPDSSTYNQNKNGLPFFQGNADFGDIFPAVRLWCSNPIKVAKKNDILISVRAPIGALNISTCECCIGRGLASLSVNQEICNQKYLWYVLSSKVNELNSKGTGSTFKAISKQTLSETEIPLPPMEEQKKIAAVLDKVSDLIAKRRRQLDKLDLLVKARFVEMFGDPENSTPKWGKTRFSSICVDMHQGINTVADKVEYVNNGVPIIQSKNITSGYLDLKDVRYVKENDYKHYQNKYNPKPSDLLVCNIGTIGKSLIVEDKVDFLIAWNLFLIKLNKELVNPYFIKVFIELLNQQHYFEKYMTGGTVKFVNKKVMGNINTPIPPMALQVQFAAFVEQVEQSKLVIQKSLEKLETLKKSLMQEYFG